MSHTLMDSSELGLKPSYSGKVRDLFDLGDRLLIVATDRISAFDVVMPQAVPGKGILLNRLSVEWFRLLEPVMSHHLISADWREFPDPFRRVELAGRSMLVHKTERFDLECVVRGYLVGSGWRDYQASGAICGIELLPGLVQADKLAAPIFTPTTKADDGHDEAVDAAGAAALVGADWFPRLRDASLALYDFAERHARSHGIIIADTKLEFGLHQGELCLIDEVFTPDSSRFWAADAYEPGRTPDSFDKQILRAHLEETGWNKEPPPPDLPDAILERILARYEEIFAILFPDSGGAS